MIAFILPLKPKLQSNNWQKDCVLLEATIRSLLNQEEGSYKIFVVFSDDPQINISSDRLSFIQFPFPFMNTSEINEAKNILPYFGNDTVMLERRWDKSRKIFYGCKMAKEAGCTYLMSVDADDLVSNKLTKYIEQRLKEKELPGFYIDKGFLYNYGNKRMIRIEKDMQNFNGSTHIIKSDFVLIPDFENGKWMDYNLFTSHGWIRQRLKDTHGIELEAIPFPAIIYVAHGGNISNVSRLNFMEKLKHFIKLILRSRKVDETIKKEFSISI
ncbi:MAG: hypothetical protein ABI237_06600 [Ginsengibacter sp.]